MGEPNRDTDERFPAERAVAGDLSPFQAAQQTGLSRTLIYREIERGHLRAYKVGGRLRISQAALSEWKRIHAVEPLRRPAYDPARLSSPRVPQPGSLAAELQAIREGRAA